MVKSGALCTPPSRKNPPEQKMLICRKWDMAQCGGQSLAWPDQQGGGEKAAPSPEVWAGVELGCWSLLGDGKTKEHQM